MTTRLLIAKAGVGCVVASTVLLARSENLVDGGSFRTHFESAAHVFVTNAPAFHVAVRAERRRMAQICVATSTNASVLASVELSLLNNMATNLTTWNARQIQTFSEMAIECLAASGSDVMKESVILRFAAARTAIKALRVLGYEFSSDINASSLRQSEISALNMRRDFDRRQRVIAQADDDMGVALVLNMIAYLRDEKNLQYRINLIKNVSTIGALSQEEEKAVLVGDWSLVRKQRK